MVATLEQTQAELPRLLALARQGEEVLITVAGQAVAKLTPLPKPKQTPQEMEQWLAELDELRQQGATGKTGGPTVEEILEDDRADRS
jgi:antitoxin (DNA-binding transcriptional repressor) of toxin-antitoxin stability system